MLRLAALVLCCATALGGVGTAVAQDSSAVAVLLDDLDRRALSPDDARTLLAVVIQQPERVAALGRSLNDVRERLLNDPRYDLVTRDEPRTPLAKALMRIRDGDVTAGDSLFEAALRSANSDAQRADFLYARASAGLGDRSQLLDGALAYDPAHGPSLYGKAHQFADRVGRRDSTDGRAAYWCLADEYRRVARVVSDERIAHAALRAARAYERAAPPPSSFGGAGWREGDQITVVYGDGETCTTTVR